MPQLRIDYPRSGATPAEVSPTFVVSGRVILHSPTHYPLGVHGLLVHRGRETDVVARGRTLLFHRPAARAGQRTPGPPYQLPYKWLIAFAAVPPGDYDLLVTSFVGDAVAARSSGGSDPSTIGVDDTSEARPVKVVARTAAAAVTIGIDWPGQDDPIADYLDYFVAYGTFGSSHNAVSATMNNIPAEYIYSENGFWSAQFPPLAVEPSAYTLVVVDQANHNDTRTGLTTS